MIEWGEAIGRKLGTEGPSPKGLFLCLVTAIAASVAVGDLCSPTLKSHHWDAAKTANFHGWDRSVTEQPIDGCATHAEHVCRYFGSYKNWDGLQGMYPRAPI